MDVLGGPSAQAGKMPQLDESYRLPTVFQSSPLPS